MQISTSSPFPYALSLYNDSNRMLTLNRRVFVNENKPINKSSIVLFRCSEFAKEFRDAVIENTDFSYNTWSLSCDEMSSSDKKYKSVVFHTKKQNMLTDFYEDKIMIPKPIEEFDSSEFIDQLVTYNISVFFMDSFDISRYGNGVNLYGHLWTPHQDVMYYTSDIEKLYNNK